MMEPPDRFCEPMWGAKRRQRAIWLPWFIWFFAIVGLIVLVAALAGCAATKPPCPSFQSKIIVSDDEDETVMGVFFDLKNAVRLAAALRGLKDGTCTISPPGTAL